jgi:VWA domain-containing protein
MRPEGCQETGRALARPSSSRNLQISNQFWGFIYLTLSKTETYTQIMSDRRHLATATTVAALLVVSLSRLGAQPNQRSMYVSVLNDAGAPVPNLGPADFIIREDNVAREVLHVAPATDPMQIALLVDNSQAARPYIVDMRNALQDFVATMGVPAEGAARNELAIIALADRPTTLTDFTMSRAQLLKGIDRIFSQSQSGTLLLEGIIDASKALKKRDARRPVIVAITTEGPELSDRYYDLVLGPLKDSGAALHAIIIGPFRNNLSDGARDRGIVLDRGTTETGGRRDNVLSSMALQPKLKELAVELTHQYRVTYAHPQSLIPPERVTVAAARPGMTARGILARERSFVEKK